MKTQTHDRRIGSGLFQTKRHAAWWCLGVSTALLSTLSPAHAELPKHNVAAASLEVIQNDPANTSASVTVTATTSVNDFRVRDGSNRGDYNVQIGDDATDDVATGIIITSITQNDGRDNGEGDGVNFVIPTIDMNGADYTGANTYYIPVFRLGGGAGNEYNINVAGAWFPYTNWIGGRIRIAGGANGSYGNSTTNNEIIGTAGLQFGQNVVSTAAGKLNLNLSSFGVDSRTDGVLLVVGGKNEGNYGLSQVNTNDGSWNLFVHDKDANGASTEEDPIAFVFIPKTNTTVVSGRFLGDATIEMFSGDTPQFTVANVGTGTYELKIPGRSPTNGVLIISAEGGTPVNQDNIVSYQANPAGDGWLIESRDGPLNASGVPGLQTPPATDAVVSFAYIPAATPGITPVPSSNLVTTETGDTASFDVSLDTQPTADVTVSVVSSNPSEGVVSTDTLIFTPSDWNIPQQVTVTGQDDAVADGMVFYSVVLTASSEDGNYNSLSPVNVQLVNADNEPGFTVTPTSGLITTEAGGTANFTVRLNAAPSGDVTINFASSNPSEGSPSPSSLIFNSSNWDQEQTVTVTGADESVDDGDSVYYIVSAPATSADQVYNGIDAADVEVTNLDDDTAGVVIAPTGSFTVNEPNTSTPYTIVLQTQPTADVTFDVVSSDTSEATVSPSTVTFTPANWNTPQMVTITAADDLIMDGSIVFSLTNSITSADSIYNAFEPITLQVTTFDNEAALTLSGVDTIYGIGTPGITVDALVTSVDAYTDGYNGATLTVALTANASADDRLEIRNTGNDPGQIGVSGSTLSYGGVNIGSFTGGSGTTPLVITLNDAATAEAAQAALRAVTFRNVSSNASTSTRSVVFTVTHADGGVSSASKAIRVGLLQQAVFQDGADWTYGTYNGAVDIQLHQPIPDTPFPIGHDTNAGIWLNWPDAGKANASQGLLRFDDIFGENPGQIPSNAVIVAAELMFNVNNPGDGSPLYRMLVPWDSETSTWNSMDNGVIPDGSEAVFPAESQFGLEDGSGATGVGHITFSVLPDLKAWASGEVNYGWAMPGFFERADGTGISPCEDEDIADRPRLRVLWLPAGTAEVNFRQNVNGYAGSHDTLILQVAPDDNLAATAETVFVDAISTDSTNNPSQVLLRFDDIVGTTDGQIPPNAQIHAAILDLSSLANSAMGHGGTFHALLKPWDDLSTWNSWDNGIDPDGIEAATTPTLAAGSPSLAPLVQGGFHSFEVTSDVQAWVNGAQPNYGWAILPWPNGGDGWGIGTSESGLETARPQLRVYYSLNTNARIQTLTWSPGSVTLQLAGVAGTNYSVQRSDNVAGPYITIGSATAGQDGTASFTDNSPLAGTGFYRLSTP